VLPEARAAVAALEEMDALDVCDARDERAHGYAFESRSGELLLAGSVAIGRSAARAKPSADAGRLIAGGEAFRVRTHKGRELVVVPVTLADRGDGPSRAGPRAGLAPTSRRWGFG